MKLKLILKSQTGYIQYIIVLVLLAAIGIGIYLSLNKQILKSKASSSPGEFVKAFEFKDQNGETIECDSSVNPPVCTTQTQGISVSINKDKVDLLAP